MSSLLFQLTVETGHKSIHLHEIDLDKPSSVIQVRYQGLGNGWSLDDIRLQLYPSSAIISPRMDIDQDGRNEWSASSEGVGTWGNQDVFIDGNF